MSPDEIAAVEARLNAATPGPWYWRNTQDVYLQGARTKIVMAFSRRGMQGAQPDFRDEHGLLVPGGRANLYDFPDAEFIANAPTDIAALLAHVKEQAAEIERLSRQVYAVQAAAERVFFHSDGLIEGEEVLIILGKDPLAIARKATPTFGPADV